MKVVQLLTNLNWGDAIGNEVLAMDDALRLQKYDARIMAFTVHDSLRNRTEDMNLSSLAANDLVIFHKATGDMLTKSVAALPCRKVLVYHNITPAKYFLPYDRLMAMNLWLGRNQLRRFAARMDMCWADSSYNANELSCCGVSAGKLKVLPILFSETVKKITPDPATEKELRSVNGTKLLCIGRIAPNKKLEDAIKLYIHYRERFDDNAILYLAGGWDGIEKYYAKLKGFCSDLGLKDNQVVFAGRVTEEEKEAYLLNSDVLLCMSEHEGFCVPLLEAMSHRLPVLAYSYAAVPETLGDSGLLFPKKDYPAMAEALNNLRKNELFRAKVVGIQLENLRRFEPETVRQQFLSLVNNVISKEA